MKEETHDHQTDLISAISEAEANTAVATLSHSNGNGLAKTNGNGNGKAREIDATPVALGGRGTGAPGLTMERRFTKPGEDVYSTVEWEKRDAVISNERGEKVFEQVGCEIPMSWTQLATNVVVSKYFRGHIGTPDRETSVRQLIGRVADTMAGWGRGMDFFATEADAQTFQDELTHILLHQKAAFNSPVWFNVGLPDQPRPQCSACFINSVEDDMESILGLARTEGMLFKFGSGTGTNLSPIRGSREKLNGGGTASGPLSFMRGFDQFAGAIKSGGKTRRAAKMVMLDVDHPDIMDFISAKEKEEKKAWALIDAGYSGAFNVSGGAYDSVNFQNANHSVRVSDEFMETFEKGGDWSTKWVKGGGIAATFKATDLMKAIGQAAWVCGDPGMQYNTTINKWHTCKNTAPIYGSNPCSEYMFLNDSACNLASINLMKMRRDDLTFDVEAFKHTCRVLITAQEIIIDSASYPTARIGENSHNYRPLGLGYANLGALLMANGRPYDSDEGRAFAGAITAVMTGEGYHQSAIIARDHSWPFPGYEKNREPFLEVMRMHRAAVEDIDSTMVPKDLLAAARTCWDDAIAKGEKHGYRNAQATVLAPTGCLVGNSLVVTSRGLVRLRSLGDPEGEKWQKLHAEVATDNGPQLATQFYVNGAEPVVTIETARGYRIQGTTMHRVKVVDASGDWVWKRFSDIRPGDQVPMLLNGLVGLPNSVPLPPLQEAYWTSDYTTFVPRKMTAELAEFVGYFMGDGSLHSKGLRLCVAREDQDVVKRLSELGKTLFGLTASITEKQGYTEVSFNSVRLTLWWEACDFAKHLPNAAHSGKGYVAHVPDAILHTNDSSVYAAFTRGLFEADGTASNGYASWSTVNETFSRDMQTLLLTLGFVTTRKTEQTSEARWGKNPLYILRLLNAVSSERFIAEIGFLSKRKRETLLGGDHPQAARYDHIPVSRELIDELAPENDNLRKAMLLSLSRSGTVSRRAADELMGRSNNAKLGNLLRFFYDEVKTAELGEEEFTYDISVPENVTYVANGFVSHNTIGFLMDCDTTGIEPDIAIVKYKSLVGGGMMKIVNNTVPEALSRLGYSPEEVKAILDYIETNDTIERAPGLKDEHLAIFDCAFKPGNGVRSIHYKGHLMMMSAAQPFLSGAISKTVNMPADATPEEIVQTYLEGWKLGLKAIAIYRDGSKRTQPLMTKKADTIQEVATGVTEVVREVVREVYRPLRRKLPDERQSITHKFSIAGHEGYLTVGMYEDRTPGEIFLTMSKEGSTISGLMDAFATAISMALQYGVPLQTLVDKFAHTRFEPSGYTNHPEIRFAKSIMDYIFRWLGSKFLMPAQQDMTEELFDGGGESLQVASASKAKSVSAAVIPLTEATQEREHGTFQNQIDAPICVDCGSLMVRNGACYKCLNCGSVFGCS